MSEHVFLLIERKNGEARREPLHAERLSNGNYLLSFSPGFVQGIAAGDEFRVLDEDGAFEVVKRGGNLAVQIYSSVPVEPYREKLEQRVAMLGGTLDGSIERGLVFTLPVTAGFDRVEALFEEFVAEHPMTEWIYGNVYDPIDGKALNWWGDVASV